MGVIPAYLKTLMERNYQVAEKGTIHMNKKAFLTPMDEDDSITISVKTVKIVYRDFFKYC